MQIKVCIDGQTLTVERSKYTQAKYKQLKKFGYNNLTIKEVETELDAILKGEKLTVIGMFMKDDIITKDNL